MNDVLGEEMEEAYNEAAVFWQSLKRELGQAIAEKSKFLEQQGVAEEDLDFSSEDERSFDGDLDDEDDTDSESVTAARRR